MSTFFTPIRLVLVAAFVVALIAGFAFVPPTAEVPVHWGMDGQADGFLPRNLALLLPAGLLATVWAIFLAVERFARPDDIAAGRYVTGVAITALSALMLLIEIVIVLVGTGQTVNVVQVLALGLGVMLLIFGNAMPKSQPNSFAGIRMPSTLKDAGNWQATHRLGGVLTFIGGLVLLGAAVLVPVVHLVWWIVGCVIVPMLTATVYSLAYERRHGPPS
jgi:uncharacterized membrane protein